MFFLLTFSAHEYADKDNYGDDNGNSQSKAKTNTDTDFTPCINT